MLDHNRLCNPAGEWNGAEESAPSARQYYTRASDMNFLPGAERKVEGET